MRPVSVGKTEWYGIVAFNVPLERQKHGKTPNAVVATKHLFMVHVTVGVSFLSFIFPHDFVVTLRLRAKLSSAVYCYRSCLGVCAFATVGRAGGRAACVCVFVGLLPR